MWTWSLLKRSPGGSQVCLYSKQPKILKPKMFLYNYTFFRSVIFKQCPFLMKYFILSSVFTVFFSPSCFAHLLATCLAQICVWGCGCVFTGADLSDYFNYGFNEDTWKAYCEKQKRLRMGLEVSSVGSVTSKITVRAVLSVYCWCDFFIALDSNYLYSDWHLKLAYSKINLLFELRILFNGCLFS